MNEYCKQLLELGDNKESIAKSLLGLNVRGQHACFNCPIGNYLRLSNVKQNDRYFALVHSDGDVVADINGECLRLSDYPQLQPIRDFVRAFDAGEFPELEQE